MDRRMFVGSLVAGLPLLAGAGTGLIAQGRGGASAAPQPHDHGTAERDELLELIAREVAAVHNRAQGRGQVTGEDARLLAAQFRTLAAYSRRAGLDDHVKRAGAELLRGQGREALLYPDLDEGAMRKELQQFGINVDRRLFELFRLPDRAQRERAVSRVLRDGASPVFADFAATFERVAVRLDQDFVPLVRIAAARQDAAYWQGYCAELTKQIADATALAAIACGPTFFGAVVGMIFAPSCAAVSGGLAVLSAVYFVRC